MLTNSFLRRVLGQLVSFPDPENQILEGNGYDGIQDILNGSRSIEWPCVILESGGSGTFQVVEGPVDTYTQSLWVMDRLGRTESEADIYRKTKELSRQVAALLLEEGIYKHSPEAADIQWQQVSYMQRYGGPDARGYELIFTFKENISLRVQPADLNR